jgi:hypothetical protein
MGLAPREQRLLSQIERALRGSDPRLAGALTAFNRVTSRMAMPHRERLPHRPSRLVRFAPIVMAVFLLCVIAIPVAVLGGTGQAAGSTGSACGIALACCQPASAHGSAGKSAPSGGTCGAGVPGHQETGATPILP